MEVQLKALLENYDRQTDGQTTDRPIDQQTDRPDHKEVTLAIKNIYVKK